MSDKLHYTQNDTDSYRWFKYNIWNVLKIQTIEFLKENIVHIY